MVRVTALLALLVGPLVQAQEVKIFDGILTQAEIQALINQDNPTMEVGGYTFEQKRRGGVRVGSKIAERIKKTLGLPQDCSADEAANGWDAETRLIMETSNPHIDHFHDNHDPVKDDVALIFLNDNEGATFVSGDQEVPIVAGRLAVFPGNVVHHTKVTSGAVHTLGPFHATFFDRGVGEPSCEPCYNEDGEYACIVRKYRGKKQDNGCLHTCMDLKGYMKASSKNPAIFDGLGCNTGQCDDPEGYCNSWWWRRLDALEETPITNEDAHRVLKEKKGDPEGYFTVKENIISEGAIDSLREYLDEAYAKDDFDPNSVPKWRIRHNLPPEAMLNHRISGEQLVDLIGKEEAATLLDYFHEAHGENEPVTSIKLQLAHNEEMGYYTPHKDNKTSLIVFLQDDAFTRGGLGYYNKDGYTLIPAEKGKAIAHGRTTLHQSDAFQGWRHILDMQSTGEGSDCILQEHVL